MIYIDLKEKTRKHILRRLFNFTYIGRRHTAIENMKQGIPPRERSMNLIKDACKELFKEGLIQFHKSGKRISLNPKALKRIKDLVCLIFGFVF